MRLQRSRIRPCRRASSRRTHLSRCPVSRHSELLPPHRLPFYAADPVRTRAIYLAGWLASSFPLPSTSCFTNEAIINTPFIPHCPPMPQPRAGCNPTNPAKNPAAQHSSGAPAPPTVSLLHTFPPAAHTLPPISTCPHSPRCITSQSALSAPARANPAAAHLPGQDDKGTYKLNC